MYVNVSVRDVLWQGTPNKEEKKKEVVQFRVGGYLGRRSVFQNTGTKIVIVIVLSSYINAGHILEFIFTWLFSLFSWLSWFGW